MLNLGQAGNTPANPFTNYRVGLQRLLTLIFVVVISGAASATGAQSSPRVENLQERLNRRVQKVNEWEWEATQQIWLSIAVGVFGLVVGGMQASKKGWAKGVSVGAGFAVSAITLFTNKVYPADYRTLQRSVTEARPIIEEMQETLVTWDPNQKADDQLTAEGDFKNKCGQIDRIEQRLLGSEPSTTPAKSVGVFHFTVAYAAVPGTPRPPAWTAAREVQTDNTSLYSVGKGESTSLTTAKSDSLEDAVHNIAHWLLGDYYKQPDAKRDPQPQLLALVRNAAEPTDTWYTYDRTTGTYLYYTRLRLTNEFRSLDLNPLPYRNKYSIGMKGQGEHYSQWFRLDINVYADGTIKAPIELENDVFGEGFCGTVRLEFHDLRNNALLFADESGAYCIGSKGTDGHANTAGPVSWLMHTTPAVAQQIIAHPSVFAVKSKYKSDNWNFRGIKTPAELGVSVH